MPLVIVESPNKIDKIKKSLDADFEVVASVGHIMDLPPKTLGIDEATFEPEYETKSDKESVVANLKRAFNRHDDIYIATDPDREGEAIAYNIASLIKDKSKNIQRVIFKELNKKEIQKAIAKPIGFKPNLYRAQQARRVTDRLVGFKVSPILWNKGLRGTSAGRVQSAGLKMIVDKEREIRAFKKEEYWSITAKTNKFDCSLEKVNKKDFALTSKEQTEEILKKIPKSLIITEYNISQTNRSPYPPFITSTMQQEAGVKLKWSAQKTMDIAQALFSKGLITYHRTDSTRSEEEKLEFIREKITDKYGKAFASPAMRIFGPKEEAQDAHEAIRPTFEPLPDDISSEEKNLFNLIGKRFMASQMADAVYEQVKVELEAKAEDTYLFKANGKVLKFEGYQKVYGSQSDDVVIAGADVDEILPVKSYVPQQHFTKPPPRYTEPAFIKKLEKDGIGRPSTYAPIIEHVVNKGYIEKNSGVLSPTPIGEIVSDYLHAYFSNITEGAFTAEMEAKLDKLDSGKIDYFDLLSSFALDLERYIEIAKAADCNYLFKTDIDCKKCAGKMRKKIAEGRVYLQCEHSPKCGFTLKIDSEGNQQEDSEEESEPCPECGAATKRRTSKFGDFVSCTGYPSCKWKKNAQTPKQKENDSGIQCPRCKKHNLMKRNGDFLGCGGYPTCTFTASTNKEGKIIKAASLKDPNQLDEICPQCKTAKLIKRKGKFGDFTACSGFPKCKYVKKK